MNLFDELYLPDHYHVGFNDLKSAVDALNKSLHELDDNFINAESGEVLIVKLRTVYLGLLNVNNNIYPTAEYMKEFCSGFIDLICQLEEFSMIDDFGIPEFDYYRELVVKCGFEHFEKVYAYSPNSIDYKAYEFFVKTGAEGVYGKKDYGFYEQEYLDQLFLENKKLFLEMYLEHVRPMENMYSDMHFGEGDLTITRFPLFAHESYEKVVEQYRKLLAL
ncbi:hypothetical protein [Endozoicomonas sp. SCSIO W0465]|uniref:hypothetical protein n=1 Tax=Endozoicomonas sp. SCSIO W0465 TaxID=2918516 RepID=UPI0020754744|nr:hypothetical protein [Endozoicomonas sp. SCSIO W0465]USE39513.1 hypothetical protein MJO57_15925 [Endozoicomonas sp. SCSIO W0465]